MTMDEGTKSVFDAVSIATVVGTLSGIIPAVAALFTIVWTSIRIYESDTIQRILNRKSKKK